MTRTQAVTEAVQRLTQAGIESTEARTEAMLLFRHTTGITREELWLRPNEPLSEDQFAGFTDAIARRERREPLAYITGERGFYGLRFVVTPAVLIPRPETEGIVEAALALFPQTVLDIGTGSGAIIVALAVHLPLTHCWATDISKDALTVAQDNAARNHVSDRITFLHGDLFAPIPPDLRFNVIVSNPPYIAPEEIQTLQPEVRDYEPHLALGQHPDALHFYRRIAQEAPNYLSAGGSLIVEVGQGQADAVAELFRDAGLEEIAILPDLAGIGRVVIGKSKTLLYLSNATVYE